MRRTYHAELKGLTAEVNRMGQVVEEAIASAVKALINGDIDLAAKVIAGDDVIDKYTVDIETETVSVIARQTPVAKDLRLVHSVLLITTHLERMGDLAHNMAKATRRISDEESDPDLVGMLKQMGEKTRELVHTSLEAFANRDLELARTLPAMDEPIDDLFKSFFAKLTKSAADHESLEWASNMILASRWLERIADHGVDIGERVAYLITGEFQEWA